MQDCHRLPVFQACAGLGTSGVRSLRRNLPDLPQIFQGIRHVLQMCDLAAQFLAPRLRQRPHKCAKGCKSTFAILADHIRLI